MIHIKRAYDEYSKNDGYRILVDRLWPRGIKKEDAAIDEWIKDIAPSAELRKWFNHDPEKWNEFKKKYTAELKDNVALPTFLATIKKHKTVTLLYGARDEQHNQAVVLAAFLQKHAR